MQKRSKPSANFVELQREPHGKVGLLFCQGSKILARCLSLSNVFNRANADRMCVDLR